RCVRAALHNVRMPFTPAVSPAATATDTAWCFAFVDGQLLLLEGSDGPGLTPQPWSLFEPHSPARHYLGQLDGIDCWAFTLREPRVHREVAEEVGVRVRDLRYYGSQSWPFPHSLMVAYTAEWVDGEIVKQEGEIEDAQWFALDALPKIPPRFSISGHLIRDTV